MKRYSEVQCRFYRSRESTSIHSYVYTWHKWPGRDCDLYPIDPRIELLRMRRIAFLVRGKSCRDAIDILMEQDAKSGGPIKEITTVYGNKGSTPKYTAIYGYNGTCIVFYYNKYTHHIKVFKE